jgi:hypothetical protein
LLIVPDGSQTRLLWERDRISPPNWPVKFLTWGDCRIDSEAVLQELALVVSSVLTRLAEQGVTETALEKEWSAVQETGQEEEEYCLAAARLGLDPYADAGGYEQQIIQASESLQGRLFTDFLDAVSPGNIQAVLGWISDVSPASGPRALRGEGIAADADVVVKLRKQSRADPGSPSALPWEAGWRQANRIRQWLRADASARFDVDRYVSKAVQPVPDRGLYALGNWRNSSQPLAVMGRSVRETSARFTLSRSLWHFVWDEDRIFLVTGAYTDRQKTERAFAAELLAPAKGIAEWLGSDPGEASQDDLDEVAEHYGVSPVVISHQVRNQLLGADSC